MSYILEALRKADAQRERARVPGLHARPLSAVVEAEPERRWGGPAMAAVLAVGMVMVGLVAWRLAGGGGTPAAAPVEAVAAVTPAAPAITPPVLSTPAAPPAPAEPATAIVPAAPPPLPHSAEPERPARAARAPATARQAEPVAAPEARSPAPATAPGAVAAAQVPAPMPAASAVPVAAPMLANAAPPGTPQLAVSGGVYSQNPAQRMLIVNGQVFNEGSEVASGVRLEEVRPNKQAVMNFRGQRFTLPY
ncbi:hypothetical protein EZ313_18910 [Ramlibacter henchirensis]|uniref:Type II secretion system protein GspB C-terminal domain-containing protein n=1 Tax=Ramlibacter henchirensis TaxID=204072 RepID=A0A4Z0BNZ6_9BURK|nr:general secretion pathway protein GspB [Ramlibacter henchirensis]TFZ00531.1 hypothetical protein EZ313_18910 [Ramlibacter henchirensis]